MAAILAAAVFAGTTPEASAQAQARTRVVPWTGQPVLVAISPGRTTAITLPAPVATIVTAATKESLSIETAGSRLYVTPLDDRWAGELFAVLSDDSEVALLLTPSAEPDLVVRVVRAQPADRAAAPRASEVWSPLRLMRAMMLGEQAPGVTVSPDAARPIVYDDNVVALRILERWRAPRYEGVVLEVENQTDLWIRIALESLDFPGLLAVSVDADSLAPRPDTPEARLAGRHKARLYLVRLPEAPR